MATLVAKSDDDQAGNGEGYIQVTPDATYLTVHDAASGFNVADYNTYLPVGQRYNIYDEGKYQIFRSVLRFDLTDLPSGVELFSAVMAILASSTVGHHTDWNIVLVDGSVCEKPLVVADYGDLEPQQTSLGSIAVSSITEETRFEITLNAAGRAYLESKAGSVAQFGLRSSDDISSTAPTGDYNAGEKTEVSYASSIKASETDKPTLTITYTPPVEIPTVTTNPATALSAVAATLNGTLDNDGGEPCECGFEWGLDIGYGITTPTQSKTKDETFSEVIGGLEPGTTYHFRAFATNSAGTGYGADRSFTTALIISKAYALAREEL